MLERAPVGIALIELLSDKSIACRFANPTFLQLCGKLPAAEPLKMSELFDEEAYARLQECFAAQDACQYFELNTKSGSGRQVTCQVKVCALSDPNFCVLTAEDVTRIAEAENQLLQSIALEQREDFVATLTHDLKTPIVGANMVLSAFLDGTLGKLNDEQTKIIGKLLTSNQALLKMIHNLLEIYRYESSSALLISDVDIVTLIKSCADELRPLLANKSQQIVYRCSRPQIELSCDPHAIQRVLINLLGNAIKFTPEQGSITAAVEDGDKEVVVKIIDTGSGIDPEDQPRLFQRFWQGEPGKRYAAGTGLGLYFCHQVVKAHHGSIVCESQPGSGSTFTVRLPKAQPLESSAPGAA